jgi:hypothetical protein
MNGGEKAISFNWRLLFWHSLFLAVCVLLAIHDTGCFGRGEPLPLRLIMPWLMSTSSPFVIAVVASVPIFPLIALLGLLNKRVAIAGFMLHFGISVLQYFALLPLFS